MSTMSRSDIAEAIKVPLIMGRGEPFGLVIGNRRFWSSELSAQVSGMDDVPETLMGMEIMLTCKYPDTLFAVTRPEWDRLREHWEQQDMADLLKDRLGEANHHIEELEDKLEDLHLSSAATEE